MSFGVIPSDLAAVCDVLDTSVETLAQCTEVMRAVAFQWNGLKMQQG